MNNITHENRDEQNNKRLYSAFNNSLVDVDGLANDVISEVYKVRRLLKQGMPNSMCQLKLFNYLFKKGFKLETELSLLNSCVKNEPDRELIIVNGVLVIECVLDDDLIDQHQRKRIMFDLQNNGHAIGLLINFNVEAQDDGVTRVYQNFGVH